MPRHLAHICAIANRKRHFRRNKPLGKTEENTVQREDVLGQALQLLEIQGIASTTLEMVADRIDYPLDELKRFWPDKEALHYDALRYLSQQVDIWRRQLMLNEELTAEQKLLARYTALTECVSNNRYPGCLFIAACTFYPDPEHPIHQLANQQKRAAHDFTHELLTTLEVDDPPWSPGRWSWCWKGV
jgi:AcrR family transcriptional regulator